VGEELPRVLHVISTLEKAGGAQRLLLSILPGLPGYRHDVAVLTGALELREELEAAGMRVLDLRKRSLFDPFGVREVRRVIREGGYQLVHCHLSRAEIVGAFAAAPLPAVKVLLFKQNDDRWWKGPLLRRVHKRVVRRADRIVCTSSAVAAYFLALEPDSGAKTARIYNGIDVAGIAAAAAAADPGALRSALGVPKDAPLLLAVGRLVEQKGHDVLLAALTEPAIAKTGAVLVLVGRGEALPALEAFARANGLGGRVVFAGVRPDVPALLAACDLFVMPSRWEGFGLVAAEAMAAGRAVVASRISALPEVVDHGVTGTLVEPDDPAALAAAIADLLADPARRSSWGRAGHARAERLFTRERMNAEWRAEYARLVPPATGNG
jgi:glycosyltransferase involved in cell wall biosynthesis